MTDVCTECACEVDADVAFGCFEGDTGFLCWDCYHEQREQEAIEFDADIEMNDERRFYR